MSIDTMGVEPAGMEPTAESQQFVYDGRIGELYGIFLVNLLLTLVTLGFYRFWGKVRMRRYIWSHTSLDGDAFEYTGTGGELFVGFLIVVGVFFIASIVRTVIEVQASPDSPLPAIAGLIFAFIIVYLIFVARYAAQRYRLTRTTWRGIRGGMTGSAWGWGIKAMLLTFLSGLTLGFAGPWVQMRLIDDRLNNSYFGDAKASIHSSSKPLYLAFLLGIAVTFIGMIVVFALLAGVAFAVGPIDEIKAAIDQQTADPAEAQAQINRIMKDHLGFIFGMLALFYVLMALLGLFAFAQYYVAGAREIARKLTMAELRFGTTITYGRLIRRFLGNALIILLTLGLGLPIAIHRTMRFLTDNIQIYGRIEGSQITQSTLQRPRYGEGLLEAFDPGII